MECLRDQFSTGVVLDERFRTLSPLNHGSFGMVFMAQDLVTNELVAIKCLTKKSAADEAGFDFVVDDKSEELVLHSRLGRHPNIVNLIHSFETTAHVYLVLEFCPRGDLYEAIRVGHGPLETEHVRRFMLELVDAVDYIHSKGIYHRDIKPENIFLTQSGSVKLGDFGLATTDKWTFETSVGSDRYMSPEQYDSAGAGYSPAQADIWAIGICLLNILFSRNPFTTPTEADPLFLDFSRDKQSLFDVFPSMSQDTYEVIVQCMNLDPTKRSLIGARNALRRVISFTVSDEGIDEFCCSDRRNVATANREPLRTPSIQSPQVDSGAFPWAKALQTSPAKPIRPLAVIPDHDSYTEDLFSKSEDTGDWCSSAQTPSMSSVIDSSLGASMNSLTVTAPYKIPAKFASKTQAVAGSLPITMAKPRNQPSMSLVFGRRDVMSKSWSDLWEEDVEEEEERARQRQALKELNSRTWSQESRSRDDNTPRQGLSPKIKTSSVHVEESVASSIAQALAADAEDLVADEVFFQEEQSLPKLIEKPVPSALQTSALPHHDQHQSGLRYSPPFKRETSGVDKWAALGERRRAYTRGSATAALKTAEESGRGKGTNQFGNGFGYTSLGHGVWDHYSSTAAVSSSSVTAPAVPPLPSTTSFGSKPKTTRAVSSTAATTGTVAAQVLSSTDQPASHISVGPSHNNQLRAALNTTNSVNTPKNSWNSPISSRDNKSNTPRTGGTSSGRDYWRWNWNWRRENRPAGSGFGAIEWVGS